jgi:hypothetical protein
VRVVAWEKRCVLSAVRLAAPCGKGRGGKRHKVTEVLRNKALHGELCHLRGVFAFTANHLRSSRAKSRDVQRTQVSRLRSTRTG